MRKDSTLDYFSKTNPYNVPDFWKAYKIRCFLNEMINIDDFGLLEFKKEIPHLIVFRKNWLKLEHFLILHAFLKMLNNNPDKRSEFFSNFLNGFYFADQMKAQQVMQRVYCCINDKLFNYLNLKTPEELKKGAPVSDGGDVEDEAVEQGVCLGEKKNPFGFGAEEVIAMQGRVEQLYKEFVETEKPTRNYQYASNTMNSLMNSRVRKQHPMIVAKQVGDYLLGGFFLLLAAAALAYLTVQTMGLIHLAWIIPSAILGSFSGVFTLLGVFTCVATRPSVSNRISSLFAREEKPKSPVQGELFQEYQPIGLVR
jgi:hypothetical protein